MSNNTENIIIDSEDFKLTSRQYMAYVVFGGFLLVGGMFMCAILFLFSTQIFDLASYLLSGADVYVEPNKEASPKKNLIWSIIFGWIFYLICMALYYLFKITYVGRFVAVKFKQLSRLVLHPFGVDLRVR